MKKIFLSLSIFLIPTILTAQVVNLNDAIKQIENSSQKEEETESEKAKSYLNRTVNNAENKDEKIMAIVMAFATFEHKFIYGYPTYCAQYVEDFSRFKTTFQLANKKIKNKVTAIFKNNPFLESSVTIAINSKKLTDTEKNAIDTEFREVAMSGYSYADMCDTFNSKNENDFDISFEKMYPAFATELLSFDADTSLHLN